MPTYPTKQGPTTYVPKHFDVINILCVAKELTSKVADKADQVGHNFLLNALLKSVWVIL